MGSYKSQPGVVPAHIITFRQRRRIAAGERLPDPREVTYAEFFEESDGHDPRR